MGKIVLSANFVFVLIAPFPFALSVRVSECIEGWQTK
jgi:hypothetical protein